MRILTIGLSLALLALTLGCGESKAPPATEKKPFADKMPIKGAETDNANLEVKMIVSEFAPVEVGAPEVPDKLKPVIKKLVEAAKVIDRLFFNQVSDKNEAWRREIAKDPSKAELLRLFDIMYGPWNRLDHNKPFYGEDVKPKGATFYPKDLTSEELEKWIEEHPDQKEAFTGYFTLIRREAEGLVAVPYSEAYKESLEPAAKLLEEAAALSEDANLKKYLTSRAASFRSNEYRDSDMDWMDLGEGDLEVVIGPYEVYEDELMGYKAAFEAFITLRNADDSKQLAKIKQLIPDMKAYLPLPDEHKKNSRGSELPISVVDVIYTAGDTRAGVQTLAFNLPNDEVVREKKGFKLVLLKNISHAKYDKILIPLAKQVMPADQVEKITFDAFFNHTLVHETAHGLGPGRIVVEREGEKVETTVNAELKDLYPAIEETKADILGVYLNYLLIEKGLHEEGFMENTYAALLAGFFRSMRFGVNEAHGKANLVQFLWLEDKGAIEYKDGKYNYVPEKMKDAIKSLTEEVLMIEALGDYERARKLLDKYGDKMPGKLKRAIASVDGVPTDLFPSFTVEKQMSAW